MNCHRHRIAASAATALLLFGPGLVAASPDDNDEPRHYRHITTSSYDGAGDDLLTAGVGVAGLLSTAAAPALSAPPTAAELRRLAIVTNYRALVDTTAGGGFGTLYGPNVGIDGSVGSGDGKIAGTETLAYFDDGSGRENVTMMVQVPVGFNVDAPCIVSAASSGSRGVYGAIGTAGEWGLKHGCAVAYTDKGTGNGAHDLQEDTVDLIDGRRSDAAAAGKDSNFTARLSAAERAAFDAATPHRFAFKHAHSQLNPEQDWGRHTLRALRFAFWLLNERHAAVLPQVRHMKPIRPGRTLVIASSASNGAGAALAAAEQDRHGLIDGVAVSEPNIQLAPGGGGTIQRGTLPPYTAGSRALYDFFSYANLLQPCAALAAAAAGAPFAASVNATIGGNRCAALAGAGVIGGETTQARADDALSRLQAYGYEPESNLLHASMWAFASPAIAVTYAYAYGRFSVADNLCGFSFGAVDATFAPAAAAPAAVAGIFATGNGVPPTAGLQIIYNDSLGGARSHNAPTALSPSTGLPDYAYDGAACLRRLWEGATPDAARVKAGVAEVYRTANLHGKPAIIVHGRSDTLIPVNFSSRPYLLRNAQVEGAASRLRYIEVTNAQHFDTFLPFPGFDTRFVPLHLYFVRAMDAMWATLKHGAALPPSQVVHTTPRGGSPGAAPPLTESHVPAFSARPAAADRISVSATALAIPE